MKTAVAILALANMAMASLVYLVPIEVKMAVIDRIMGW